MPLDLRLSASCHYDGPFWFAAISDIPALQCIDEYPGIDMPCSLAHLRESTEREGILPLFICCCGYPSCDSVWVEVLHKKNEILWKRAFGPGEDNASYGKQLGKIGWPFPRDAYIDTIARALEMATLASSIWGTTEPAPEKERLKKCRKD